MPEGIGTSLAVRLVLDTNVLVAAQRSGAGASALLLSAARERRVTLLASTALFVEYEAVLTRAEHLSAAGATREVVIAALDALATIIEPVEIRFMWRPLVPDPDDDMVLEATVNGRADGLVTFEVTTFAAAVKSFGIDVMTPAEAWSKIAK
jgi:putative PIN family toxin of toxin-antitoxin system